VNPLAYNHPRIAVSCPESGPVIAAVLPQHAAGPVQAGKIYRICTTTDLCSPHALHGIFFSTVGKNRLMNSLHVSHRIAIFHIELRSYRVKSEWSIETGTLT